MSFDLKPEIPISMVKYSIMTKSVDDIVWTVSRSPVPPVLAGRDISESMWARSFDMMMQLDRRNESRWLEILESQKEIYQRFGIEVTLAKSLGSGRDSNMYTVGLQFTVADDGPPPTGFTTKKVEADDEAVPSKIV